MFKFDMNQRVFFLINNSIEEGRIHGVKYTQYSCKPSEKELEDFKAYQFSCKASKKFMFGFSPTQVPLYCIERYNGSYCSMPENKIYNSALEAALLLLVNSPSG